MQKLKLLLKMEIKWIVLGQESATFCIKRAVSTDIRHNKNP